MRLGAKSLYSDKRVLILTIDRLTIRDVYILLRGGFQDRELLQHQVLLNLHLILVDGSGLIGRDICGQLFPDVFQHVFVVFQRFLLQFLL